MQHRQQRQRIWTWDKVSHIHPIFLGRMAIADGNLKGPQHRTGSMNGFAENSHILRAAQRSCLYLELLNMIRSADAGHQGGAGIWDVPIKLEFEKTREEAGRWRRKIRSNSVIRYDFKHCKVGQEPEGTNWEYDG